MTSLIDAYTRPHKPNYFHNPHSIVNVVEPWESNTRSKRAIKKSLLLRQRVFLESTKEYALFCPICNSPLEYAEANIDHIIPRRAGGNSFIMNLQLTHVKCNYRKDQMKSPKLARAFV